MIVNLFSTLMPTSRGIDKAISVTNVTIWTEWMQYGDSGIEANMPNRGDNVSESAPYHGRYQASPHQIVSSLSSLSSLDTFVGSTEPTLSGPFAFDT